MTQAELDLLIATNVEQPVRNVLVLAKSIVKDTTDSGIKLDPKTVEDLLKRKDPMYVIASHEDSTYSPGDKVRTASFLLMNPPLECTVEGYQLVVCREHDVLTVIK